MEKFKLILKKIFFLPPLATILISLPSFIFVFSVLGMGINGAAAYIAYGLSAYGLVIAITGFKPIVQAVRLGINSHPLVKKLFSHPFGGRYLKDAAFRAEVSIYPSLVINMMYAATKMLFGILYNSVWFITLSVYYILLVIMRFLVLTTARRKHIKADIIDELRSYRICGILLVFMNMALSGMILYIVRHDGGYDYPGVLIYVMAIYAFYAVITAIINIVKFRRHGSPVLSAAKAINLTAALVSMLALETAMLNQFGQNEDSLFRRIMTAASGSVVCLFVLGMAIYMIVHATKGLKNKN